MTALLLIVFAACVVTSTRTAQLRYARRGAPVYIGRHRPQPTSMLTVHIRAVDNASAALSRVAVAARRIADTGRRAAS